MATTTTRLALRKPAATDSITVSTDINASMDKLDGAVGSLVCTSTTRPASPFSGQTIWQTDTSSQFVWTGSVWAPTASAAGVVGLTDAATITTNASLGNHFAVTLGGNRTLANPTSAVDGQKLLFEFVQDGTGGRTITLGSNFKLGTDVTGIVLSTGAGKRDFMGCVYRSGTGFFYVVGFSKGY